MSTAPLPPRIKECGNWIAAGDGFRNAAKLLSDGAFKLFAYLSLQADYRTGRVVTTYKALAAGLRKSKRAIGVYAAELNEKGVCRVRPGENQYSPTTFAINDSYWPYERKGSDEVCEPGDYVDGVRSCFLALGCTRAGFSAADVRAARELERQGVPLQVVEDALLIGACRKYDSWLGGRESAPIGSLRYFEDVIGEVQRQPFPPDYGDYLRSKIQMFSERWARQNAIQDRQRQPDSSGASGRGRDPSNTGAQSTRRPDGAAESAGAK
jgi:hypothetical protein